MTSSEAEICEFEIVVYIIGSLSNIILLYVCCRKDTWREFGNTKYLLVSQAVFSLLTILSYFGLVVEYVPRRYCNVLSKATAMGLSLALFNFMFLAIVKHAQVTRKWQLRSSSVMLIIVSVFVFSAALFVYTSVVGLCIIINGCPDVIIDGCTTSEPWSTMNVSYASVYITLQFINPGIIIINRLVLVGLHLWRSQSVQSKPSTPSIVLELLTNTISVLVVVLLYIFFLVPRENNDTNTLASLNEIFNGLAIVSMTMLCFPIVLCEMIMITSKDSTSTVCVAENTEVQLNDKENLIPA